MSNNPAMDAYIHGLECAFHSVITELKTAADKFEGQALVDEAMRIQMKYGLDS
jgi:hypothetical protein